MQEGCPVSVVPVAAVHFRDEAGTSRSLDGDVTDGVNLVTVL
jgi:hypothetical protein